ncbi:MAG: MFS transporter, partial [Gammaproteobacteria bacterium]|nr:MFS transporter [Gammaproteobacteria bacterium]
LHGDAHVVTFILTLFSIGIGLGALLCNWLARQKVELGLVIFGAAVLALFFGLFLWFIPVVPVPPQLFGLSQFLSDSHHWPMIASLLLLSIGTGFYTVPLYTLLQAYSSDADRSRTIAANNIFNALFMVLAALLGIVVFSCNGSIEQLFMITLGLHVIVNVVLFIIEPEYWRAFVRWISRAT